MKNLHMHHVLFDHETSMGISPPKFPLAEMMLDQLQFCLELLLRPRKVDVETARTPPL